MSDLISREDAIKAIVRQTSYDNVDVIRYECRRNYEKDNGWLGGLKEALEAVESLPSAEPERKKGKWIEVHGYVTPGGDPVWKCSECGKGIHVYGIEAPSYNRDYTDGHQWVSCPNCGADMRGG